MEKKPSSHSFTVQTAQIFPPEANAYGTLFGGNLMSNIDEVASIAAVRHAKKMAITASTDSVDFLTPIKVGDFIGVEGIVTYTHHTSMEVFVKVVREDLKTDHKEVCATAFLTFVAIDEDGSPTPVPKVYPQTEDEKLLYEGAKRRKELREKRRLEARKMAEMFNQSFLSKGI